jgi:hypothetical protein
MPAASFGFDAAGQKVTTIEGLARGALAVESQIKGGILQGISYAL